MMSVSQWWAMQDQHKPWLILGKGPSLDQHALPPWRNYHRLALNHAVTRQPVLIASAIDLEVLEDCAEAIRDQAVYLLMPRHPHREFRPTPEPLEHWFSAYPLLAELSLQGRLLWYNFFNAPAHPGAPVVPRGRFSAQVMVNLLALLGTRQIRTLGVDGGAAYAAAFDPKHRLANRHPSFDVQWQGIAHTVRRYYIDYAPLGVTPPLKVTIISDPAQQLAAWVLAYSLRRHTPISVDCQMVTAPPPPGDTPGVVLQATTLVVKNLVDGNDGDGLLHYDSSNAPWLNAQHPGGTLWVGYLRDALADGFIPWQMVDDAIHAGQARASLKPELRLGRRYWAKLRPVIEAMDHWRNRR